MQLRTDGAQERVKKTSRHPEELLLKTTEVSLETKCEKIKGGSRFCTALYEDFQIKAPRFLISRQVNCDKMKMCVFFAFTCVCEAKKKQRGSIYYLPHTSEPTCNTIPSQRFSFSLQPESPPNDSRLRAPCQPSAVPLRETTNVFCNERRARGCFIVVAAGERMEMRTKRSEQKEISHMHVLPAEGELHEDQVCMPI